MSYDLATLVIRVVFGLTISAHGAQKLFGWFGGGGFSGARSMTTSLRLRPVLLWTVMAGLTEFGGGLMLSLGFLSPLGSLAVIAAMLTAIITAHWPRFFASNKGLEYPLLLLVGALSVGISGPGAYSLDALLGLSAPEPVTLVAGLALVVVGVALALVTRAPEQVAAPAPASANDNRSRT